MACQKHRSAHHDRGRVGKGCPTATGGRGGVQMGPYAARDSWPPGPHEDPEGAGMSRRIVERTVPVRVAPPPAPPWARNRPPDPTAADEGTFGPRSPEWTIFIIAHPDNPEIRRLYVHDRGDLLFEAEGCPSDVREIFDLLTGTGPLSQSDIRGVLEKESAP